MSGVVLLELLPEPRRGLAERVADPEEHEVLQVLERVTHPVEGTLGMDLRLLGQLDVHSPVLSEVMIIADFIIIT